jgi:hypothetical protein
VTTRTRRLLISVTLAVSLLVGLLAIGYHYTWWGPAPPHDPGVLVLRVRFVGGLSSPVDRPVPDISVYSDGRVLTTAIDLAKMPAREVVRDQQLTGMAYRRVYRDAYLAGLAKSRVFNSDAEVSDGGSTVVTFLAGGRQRVSTVQEGSGDIRVWLIDRLVRHLQSLQSSDLVRPPTTYRPARMAIVAQLYSAGLPDASTKVRLWPLRPLTADQQATCTLLTGADVEAAAQLAESAPPYTQWRSGPNLYYVFFRPLLPDETDCTAITR